MSKTIVFNSIVVFFLLVSFSCSHGGEFEEKIVTVDGVADPDSIGITLPHEHVMVDFIGADSVDPDRYDRDEVFQTVLPYLMEYRRQGGKTLMECTPAYLARDPRLLKRLARASGIDLLTNTGYYGAQNGKFLPEHAYTESAVQLSERWLAEWNRGIDDTGVKPGFIKISVDEAPLSAVQRKIVRAAALTHRESGLTVASHTTDGRAVLEELDILESEEVDPRAFIWVHAQAETDTGLHLEAARQGAWIEFDGIRPGTVERHAELVGMMRRAGMLDRVLVSHDAGWYEVGKPGGGSFRTYTTLFTDFIPALKTRAFSESEIGQLLVNNPGEAFKVHRRLK